VKNDFITLRRFWSPGTRKQKRGDH